jgi:UDP-N-acetylmuramoyl-L-alanyl-D-glutamate--2,6-diaminopimelate ligase
MKELIKKFIPDFFLNGYHYSLALLAKWFYGNPSDKMIVVGVTGTAGKSSTCYFITQLMQAGGFKAGMTTTTLFGDGQCEWLNDKKMTMLGRFQTQKLLKKMVDNGCKVAVIETSSQGIEQYRHLGINYDILVMTNLYPEHIEAHGGFDNYKRAKGKLFEHLKNSKIKTQISKIPKTIIVNLDDEYADYFLGFKAEKKITYAIVKKADIGWGDLKINLLGEYNKYNVLAAVAVAQELGIRNDKIKKAVANLKPLPGRLEFIENKLGIKIIVDYSFEPKAVKKLYQTIEKIKYNKLIHVLGSTGGGRDRARRPLLGKLANQKADAVIVTNEDPYDEEPEKIIDEVAEPVDKQKLHKIMDRRQAIRRALQIAKENDIILITGKGAEQAIVTKNNKKITWDDRKVVREELQKIAK